MKQIFRRCLKTSSEFASGKYYLIFDGKARGNNGKIYANPTSNKRQFSKDLTIEEYFKETDF
jgi:hypothetical protein